MCVCVHTVCDDKDDSRLGIAGDFGIDVSGFEVIDFAASASDVCADSSTTVSD